MMGKGKGRMTPSASTIPAPPRSVPNTLRLISGKGWTVLTESSGGERDKREKEEAMSLLHRLVQVGKWAESGDPRAQPFLEADAVRVVNGKACFHPQRFDAVVKREGFDGLSSSN